MASCPAKVLGSGAGSLFSGSGGLRQARFPRRTAIALTTSWAKPEGGGSWEGALYAALAWIARAYAPKGGSPRSVLA